MRDIRFREVTLEPGDATRYVFYIAKPEGQNWLISGKLCGFVELSDWDYTSAYDTLREAAHGSKEDWRRLVEESGYAGGLTKNLWTSAAIIKAITDL